MHIFFARQAVRAPGAIVGRTRITAVTAETADDEPTEVSAAGKGQDHPWLARFAIPAEGGIQGRTLETKAIETSDDEP